MTDSTAGVPDAPEDDDLDPDGSSPDVEPEAAPEADAEPDAEPGAGPGTDAAPVGPRKFSWVAGVGIAIVVFDQLTKAWALDRLSGGRIIEVVGSLRFNLAYNTGTAFSMGSGKGLGPWISVLAIVVVVALSLGYTSRFRLGAAAAGLIAGGAIGNLADRAFRGDEGFLHGAVIDFVDLQWWPVFNVADAAIVVGAGLLVLASIRSPAP